MPDDGREETLREALGLALRRAEGPVGSDEDHLGAIRTRALGLQVRRRRRRSLIAAATLILAGGAVILTLASSERPSEQLFTGESGESEESVTDSRYRLSEAVRELPLPPIAPRWKVSTAWSGEEFIVWGGSFESFNMGATGEDEYFLDGAAYNPSTGEWRTIPPAPFPERQPVGMRPDIGTWTERGFLATSETAAAVWDPDSNAWQRLEDAADDVRDLIAIPGGAISFSTWQRLDVAEGTWSDLPTAPHQLRVWHSVWTGEEVVVVGETSERLSRTLAMAYDPADNDWREIADPPPGIGGPALGGAWDGSRAVFATYDMTSAAYEPAHDRWVELPQIPVPFWEADVTLVAVDGSVLALLGSAAAVLTDGDQWLPIPYRGPIPEPGLANAVGVEAEGSSEVLKVGITRESRTNRDRSDAAFTAVAIDMDLLSRSADIQVGMVELAIPDEFSLTGVGEPWQGLAHGIEASLLGPAGACDVTVWHSGYTEIENTSRVTVEHLDGRQMEWRSGNDGRSWEIAADRDVLRIECDDASDAESLARHTSLPDFGE